MDINVEKLEELINNNYTLAINKRKQIALLEANETQETIIPTEVEEPEIVEDDNFVLVNNFTDTEMEEYISLYNNLKTNFTTEDLLSILPDLSNYRYFDIVLRLKLESQKEIHDLCELCALDDDKSEKNMNRYLEAINFHERKMALLDECDKVDEGIVVGEEHKNKLILVLTPGGNVRLIEELEKIPIESHPIFLDLLNSIVDGTFKGFKRFTSNLALRGISEVSDGIQARIAITRIGVDSYAMISAFVKKTETENTVDMSTLTKKVSDYRSQKEFLIKSLSNSKFIEENEKNVKQLFDLLNTKKNKNKKVLKKGGLNG